MDHIFVIAAQRRLGPLNATEVRGGLENHDFEAHDWAWLPGMDAWRPLREVLPDLFPQREALAISGENQLGKLLIWGIGTAVAGLVIACAGFVMLAHHTAVAELFGAQLAFGMPWSSADAQKVQMTAFGASMVLAYGAIVIGAGAALVSRGRRKIVAVDAEPR